MIICWYCHWGWAKPVVEIYHEAVKKLSGNLSPLEFGPAHIVWSDENFEDENIKYCLECAEKFKDDYTAEEISVIKWSLEELLKIPEDVRCPEPEDYDGEHPELFPPKSEVAHPWVGVA